nr:reverse transcriptase domain-containing protein [Tanacetum cinerariifolium]
MEGVTTEMPITTVEEKAQRRLKVKSRSTLMMGVPNKHQLKFNSIKDSKKLLKAVEDRFVNTAHRVSAANTQVNIAYSTNIDNLSDAVICSFFASQENSPQLIHKDLEQIHPDDMEEMDLRWQMAMLTMRARRLHDEAVYFHLIYFYHQSDFSVKTSLKHHEGQIEEILNHLDELSLDRIEHMENKIKGLGNGRVIIQQDFDKLETKLQEARAQISRFYRKQIRQDDEIVLSCVRTSTLEMIIKDIQTESVFSSSNCAMENKVTFATGTLADDALNKGPATGSNLLPVSITCHACGEIGHYRIQCPKANNSAHVKAYLKRDKNAHRDPNVVTSTFLLNQHLARVLFNSGADKSFVSISLASMLNIPTITLDTTYDIEMANGNLVSTNTIIQGCTLILLNQTFEIDLMSIKLGSFDIVIAMDWLFKYHARIICDEKVVHIPINDETLII